MIGFAGVTNVASASEGSWNFFGCNGVNGNGITCSDTVLFYAPLALGPGTPNTVYFGTDRLYRSADRGQTNVAVSQAPISAGVPISSIEVSAQNDNVRIVGLANGQVFATTTGSTALSNVTGGWAMKFVARTVIDPNNSNTAYVTLDGYGTAAHVWKTTNLSSGPPAWTAVSNGLPDVPVNAFAVDALNSNNLYAGTDIGVFNSTDAGANWAPYGTGLPRVAVFDLNIQKSAHKIRIGTHGRGAWEIAAVAVSAPPDFTVSVSSGTQTIAAGQSANFTFTVTPQNGFNSTITFTCSGLPQAASCSFNPPTVTPGGIENSTILTISTTVRTFGAPPPSGNLGAFLIPGAGFFGLALLGGFSSRKRRLQSAGMLLLALGMIMAMASCGGGSSQPTHIPQLLSGTPAGTSTVTVTETSGSTTHTSTITLNVQ